MAKLCWPAPERNKGPILEVLARVLPAKGRLLEVASGTGQHAAYFAERLPGLMVQPSDVSPANLESIRAWVSEVGLPNLLEPIELDVTREPWPTEPVDAIFSANLVHIAPWSTAEALIRGVGRHLGPEGIFAIYGPFKLAGEHTSDSNRTFDEDLRRRDPSWGVRDAEVIIERAAQVGLGFLERVQMPANNQTLLFARAATG